MGSHTCEQAISKRRWIESARSPPRGQRVASASRSGTTQGQVRRLVPKHNGLRSRLDGRRSPGKCGGEGTSERKRRTHAERTSTRARGQRTSKRPLAPVQLRVQRAATRADPSSARVWQAKAYLQMVQSHYRDMSWWSGAFL